MAGVLPFSAETGITTDGDEIFLPAFSDSDGRRGDINAQHATNERLVVGNEADDRLSDICQAARDQNIIIYAVSFEAPTGGQAALLDCVGGFAGRFFDVDGEEIETAFDAIAANISSLKLTE